MGCNSSPTIFFSLHGFCDESARVAWISFDGEKKIEMEASTEWACVALVTPADACEIIKIQNNNNKGERE